ncbi:hypothetical protein [Cellulosimicrobium cellulans]|uniref:hypothetical protein n=1 Tax=Cellulosimicrobium cellulans TaxID=1710 RepID=UPI00130D918A|nr:hypothetical protein [Cellulosimicrobium cellulans]
MSDTDGRFARRDPGTPATGVGRFGGDRPAWPSLSGGDGDAGGTGAGGAGPAAAGGPAVPTAGWTPAGAPAGPAAPVPAPAAPGAPVPAASDPVEPPSRRSRRFAAADGTAPAAPVDPAERTAALARADAALQAGEEQARTAALARAAAAMEAAGGAAATDPGDARVDDAADAGPARGRRRWVLVGAVVAAVLVLAGGGTAWFLTRDSGGGAAAPPDVVLPSPTSSVEPVARPATTAFAGALPTTLLQYALASSADDEALLAQNAVEAYAETYTDGADGTVSVQAGQWETPEQAAAVLAAVTGAPATAEPAADSGTEGAADAATDDAEGDDSADAAAGGPMVLLQDEVLVDGAPVGTVTVVDQGDGTGVAMWSNGTTVFVLRGPASDIRNLYAAYPL